MGVVIDIIGSFIVRASIVAILLTMIVNLHDALYRNTDRAALQTLMDAPQVTIESDLKMAGYNASTTFDEAKSDHMRFYADIDNDGSSDQIDYKTSSPDADGHMILTRKVNGVSMELARDVTNFTLTYYDVYGNQISYGGSTTGIKSIYVQIVIESATAVSGLLDGSSDNSRNKVSWEEQIFPKNL